ncbi:hypothetical protein HIM_04610 [Hirsutella minnesotensis 3608]|uniref:PhoD-like phosphatase domain-containing protein n=1 Tax=Hirsutella minnesotensis 3608 TaxID=1043627 RepID=A0A0F8A5Y8_9HYPO|nr:hypothetical protein HIM_04610 [Hirsutella minnesotensis 3608]
MSAPYWGQLPEPNVVKDGRRRMSVDKYDDFPPPDYRQSDDLAEPRRNSNRVSVQTTVTDAPTESTFSPRSPGASNFPTQALAPRPPSFQRRTAPDPAFNVPVRMSRAVGPPTGYDDISSMQTRPVASNVPRGPPATYRHPHDFGRGHFAGPASLPDNQPRYGEFHAQEEDLGLQHHYTTRNDPQTAFHHQPPQNVPSQKPQSFAGQEPAPQSRRLPASASSERRKMFANDRSPLQKLELTLDSMTKEEKRARVEAAEQRARQRAALKASQASADSQTQSVNHRPPAGQPDDREGQDVPPRPPFQSGVTPATVPSASQQGVAHPEPPQLSSQPRTVDLISHTQGPSMRETPMQTPTEAATRPGFPVRNLSFRDRAARNEPLPRQEAEPSSSASTAQGFSMIRSGSNKLRKEPRKDARPLGPNSIRLVPGQPEPSAQAREHSARAVSMPIRGGEPSVIDMAPSDESRPPGSVEGARVHGWTQSQGVRRPAAEPVYGRKTPSSEHGMAESVGSSANYLQAAHALVPEAPVPITSGQEVERPATRGSSEASYADYTTRSVDEDREHLRPGAGLYKPPNWMDEWKKGTTGTLSGALLEPGNHEQPHAADKDRAWWETGERTKGASRTHSQRRAEAFDGEYDDANAPTRFKPPLYLRCGPLLRFCGTRRERFPVRSHGSSVMAEREIWRGSVMIVTKDSESSYEITPMLRLFVQNIALLPPPPEEVNGELPSEYVDPIAGHPKLGRRGETLFVRPVEQIEERKDVSRDESDSGLFETTRSPPEVPPADGSADPPGSFICRMKASGADREKMQKFKDVRGFRLHAERGYTFWRFNVEVELLDRQQRIAYRINRGPSMGFWVPERGQAMNIMFYNGNGFHASVRPDSLSGPDPMWRDVLNTHQSQPFHVMIGGGNQIFNDLAAYECDLLGDWLEIQDPIEKESAPFTANMQEELEIFYLHHYCAWFSQGLYGLATSQIPMVNMYDDQDIFDGFGSYSHHDMNGPVYSGLGVVAFKYYMLFQQQSLVTETEASEPSLILGMQPGPYVNELSRSLFLSLGGKVALLAVDCRTERSENKVMQEKTWEKIMNRLYAEIRRGQVEHLLVLSPVPLAYPRFAWSENRLTSKFIKPSKGLGKAGFFGKSSNSGGLEMLGDVNGHWVASNHRHERSIIIEDLQDLAIDKSMRVTILRHVHSTFRGQRFPLFSYTDSTLVYSGGVNMTSIGQFYSNPKLGLAKHRDPRYMPNIVASAIANEPPTNQLADMVNKRTKVHHFDKQTEEGMIPLFWQGVDGRSRSNKHHLPHRSWCSIQAWTPGTTPPPSPPQSAPGSGGYRRDASRHQIVTTWVEDQLASLDLQCLAA